MIWRLSTRAYVIEEHAGYILWVCMIADIGRGTHSEHAQQGGNVPVSKQIIRKRMFYSIMMLIRIMLYQQIIMSLLVDRKSLQSMIDKVNATFENQYLLEESGHIFESVYYGLIGVFNSNYHLLMMCMILLIYDLWIGLRWGIRKGALRKGLGSSRGEIEATEATEATGVKSRRRVAQIEPD